MHTQVFGKCILLATHKQCGKREKKKKKKRDKNQLLSF